MDGARSLPRLLPLLALTLPAVWGVQGSSSLSWFDAGTTPAPHENPTYRWNAVKRDRERSKAAPT